MLERMVGTMTPARYSQTSPAAQTAKDRHLGASSVLLDLANGLQREGGQAFELREQTAVGPLRLRHHDPRRADRDMADVALFERDIAEDSPSISSKPADLVLSPLLGVTGDLLPRSADRVSRDPNEKQGRPDRDTAREPRCVRSNGPGRPRNEQRCDERQNFDRHAAYVVAAFVAGG